MPYGLLSCLWPRGPDTEDRAKIQRKSFRQTTPSYKQPQSNLVYSRVSNESTAGNKSTANPILICGTIVVP